MDYNTKMKAKSKFDLNSMGKTWIEIIGFGTDLLQSLGDEIVTYKTKKELIFYTLKQIYPINIHLNYTDKSIDKGCEKILSYFGFFDESDTKIFVVDSNGKEINLESEENNKSNLDIFCKDILQLDFLPYVKYRYLQNRVDKDLRNISDLIFSYEQKAIIKRLLKTNARPHKQKERMYYDFYQRCLSERINILNYKIYDLLPNALKQSRGTHGMIDNMAFIHKSNDVPYHFGKVFYERYFDAEKIDLVSHRVGDFDLHIIGKLFLYYRRNKGKFYRIYFKLKPAIECFTRIKTLLNKLEILKKRMVIFDEMEILFKSKKWIGFYALALPQIEGLFSEMCYLLSLNDTLSFSLSKKVEKVRPFYSLNKVYFDYFQYFIPLQRNKFTHIGYDEDFKLKSYDMLTDILFLLETIFELENPVINLANIIDGKKKYYFKDITEFNEYFGIVTHIYKSQKEKIRIEMLQKVKEFEANKLCKMQETENVCIYIMDNIESTLRKFNKLNLNFTKIGDLLKNSIRFKEVKEMFDSNLYYLKSLKEYKMFLSEFTFHLSGINQEYYSKLCDLQKKYIKILSNIVYLEKEFNKQQA
jgi:hypothetical protein